MSFIGELRRRNVFRAAVAYAAVAWLLMQVAEVTFPAFGLSERALRLLIIVLAIGSVPAVTLAWVFELTPEGLKRESELDRSGALVARTNRLLDRVIMALLAIGLTYFAVDKFLLDPARDEARVAQALEQGRSAALEEQLGDKSIVVLPFKSLSADPEQEFFADGMTEEMLNLLARIPELRVISRTSAFAFKGKEVGLAEIAGTLKVTHALEGSVRRSGDRIRITAQLVDTSTDSQLWSETYDRTLDDVFAVQDEIARRVIDALKLELIGEVPKSKRVDSRAYLLFMQARQKLDRSDPDYARINALLRQALEIDPGYADPWTALSLLYWRCRWKENREDAEFCRQYTIDEARRLQLEALDEALSLDPDNATATVYHAWNVVQQDWNFAAAAPGIVRALSLDPANPDVLRSSIVFARFIRRPEDAIRLGEYAVARDPLCTSCLYYLARSYQEAGQLDLAEQTMLHFATATNLGGWKTIATTRLLKGEPESALEALANIEGREDTHVLQARSMILHSLGRRRESREALAALETGGSGEEPDLIAEVYAWMGDTERALDWLEEAAAGESRPTIFPFDWTSPSCGAALATERDQALLRRFGMADGMSPQSISSVSLPAQPEGSGVRAQRSATRIRRQVVPGRFSTTMCSPLSR